MTNSNKIDNLFKDYEQLLGENIDSIEPQVDEDMFQDDPEMKKLQMQLNKQQKNLPKNLYVQEEQPHDQLDDDLKAFEQQMRGEQRAPVQKQNKNPMEQFLQQEQHFTRPDDFRSFLLIQHELNTIQKENLQQPQVKSNQELVAFYQETVTQLRKTLMDNTKLVDQGKLNSTSYLKLVDETFQIQLKYFSEARKSNIQMFTSRIQKRLKILENEKKSLEQDQNALQKIVNQTKILATASNQSGNQQQQSKQNSNDDTMMQESVSKIVQNHFDSQPREEKFITLLKFHKKNFNYITYLMNNLKEQRVQEIQQLTISLQKGKACREEFLAGQNPLIGSLLVNDLKEVTFERFHQMNLIEFQSRIVILIEQITKARSDEEKFMHSIQKTKTVAKGATNPVEQSLIVIQQYNQLLKYLQQIENKLWVPLPLLQRNEELRVMVHDNRDIPSHTLRVNFKRLMNIVQSKYYIIYSLEVKGEILSQQTDICGSGCVFNYQKDIPIIDDRKSAKDLHTKMIEIRVMEKGFFSDTIKGQLTISLQDLELNHTIEGTVSISKKHPDQLLEYGIYLREPVNKGKRKIDVFKIVKMYPEFDVEEGLEDFVNKFKVQLKPLTNQKMVEEEPTAIQEKQKIIEEQIKEQEQQQVETESFKLIMLIHMENDQEFSKIKQYLTTNSIPNGITSEEVLFPENPQKAMVFSFIEKYTEFLSEKLIEVRQDISMRPQSKFLQNTYDEYLRSKSRIQKKLEAQDYEWYASQVNPSIQRDKLLKDIYQKANAPTWGEFVQIRLGVAENEMKELESS